MTFFQDQRTGVLARYWLVFIACLALLVFRGWDRLTHTELFAEDFVFIGDALNYGWSSVFMVKDQFWHVAPRTIANLAVDLIPVAQIPFFTNLACYVIVAAVFATPVRPGFGWIVPSDFARIILALLLTLAPGMIETLGSMANLHWSLIVWLGLLTLKDPDQSLTAWELLLVVLTLFTSAGAVVFGPVVFLRLLFARGRHSGSVHTPAFALPRLTGEIGFFVAFLTVAVFLIARFITQDVTEAPEGIDVTGRWPGLVSLIHSLGALFATFYVVHPFLGTDHSSSFIYEFRGSYIPMVTSITLISLLLFRIGRTMNYHFWLIPAWLFSLMLLATMLAIARYWAFYGVFSFPYFNWWSRYHFVFACTGLILWFILLRPQDLRHVKHWSTSVLFVLVVAYVAQVDTRLKHANPPHANDGYAVKRYGEIRYWRKTADALEQSIKTGCPQTVKVQGYPRGKWGFVYKSPLPKPMDCPLEDDS